MPNLLRKPLPWIVLAECAIVVALAVVAWHMIASPPVHLSSGAQSPLPTAQAREPVSPTSAAVTGEPSLSVPPLLPGLNVDASFWRQRLADLNRGQSSFEQLEWSLVHTAMDVASRYVKSVVLPSLARAARPGH